MVTQQTKKTDLMSVAQARYVIDQMVSMGCFPPPRFRWGEKELFSWEDIILYLERLPRWQEMSLAIA